jgi:uncharacterized protein (DUF1330 family)
MRRHLPEVPLAYWTRRVRSAKAIDGCAQQWRTTRRGTMTAYALAHLRKAPVHAEVVEYVERIQSTLDPFGGRFLVHGGPVDVMEGTWPGDVVIIEFPDRDAAHKWYDSDAYQEIKPLRTRHLAGEVIIVEGVEPGHSGAKMAAKLRGAISSATG